MILIAGIVVGIIIVLLLVVYFVFPSIKKKISKNKGKIVATVAAATTITAGLSGIGDISELPIDGELIADYSVYEKYGYDLDKIDNPVLYESEVLSEGHLPIALKLDLSDNVQLNSLNNLINIQEVNKKGFGKIDYTIRILKEYQKINKEPIYDIKDVLITKDNCFGMTEKIGETVKVKYVNGYNSIPETRYKFTEIDNIKDLYLSKQDVIIIDIVGNFKAGLKERKVDIVPTVNIDKESRVFTEFAWWNSNWNYRKLITYDTTQISGSLTNFPFLINISDSDLYDHTQAFGQDIAFIDYYDNITQFNHEIDVFNKGGGVADLVAWVNDTDMDTNKCYMYYGNAMCADQQNVAGTWDSNYKLVYHMTGTDYDEINDSTINGFDVTVEHGNPTYSQTSDAITGYGVDFDGDDYFNITDIDDDIQGNHTMEIAIVAGENMYGGDTYRLIATYVVPQGGLTMQIDANRLYGYTVDTDYVVSTLLGITNGEYRYLTTRFIKNTGGSSAYMDTHDITNIPSSKGTVNNLCDTSLAGSGILPNPSTTSMVGIIDEVRISNIARSPDWLETSYNTNNNKSIGDVDSFLSLGAEEGQPEVSCSFELRGVSSPWNITWSGISPSVVWCNNSGDKHEYPEINMSLNSSVNITDIRMWVCDLNNSQPDIGSGNITLYVSSDNSSFGSIGSFLCSNITINSTTWSAGTMGADPFTDGDDSISDRDCSIYFRLKLSIPSGYNEDIYYSLTKTAWKIYFLDNT